MNTKGITTKTGDRGITRLYSGEEIPKDSPSVEAYGIIDELVSSLGIARNHCKKEETKEAILFVQKALFTVAFELATKKEKLDILKKGVNADFIKELDKRKETLEQIVKLKDEFIVPGKNLSSAHLDFSRTIARRCERRIVRLFNEKSIYNEDILIWMNRLSDYLYLLARYEE